MKRSMIGVLAAGAVVSLLGTTARAAETETGDAKACYRTHCGHSVSGHKGSCSGTQVSDLTTEKACTDAGGAWTTAEDAKKYEKKKKS